MSSAAPSPEPTAAPLAAPSDGQPAALSAGPSDGSSEGQPDLQSRGPARPDLEARYGGPLISRRATHVLLGIGAAVAIAVLAMVGLRYTVDPIRAETVAYDHLDAQRIAISFQLTAPPGTAVRCGLEALNEGRAQVGFLEVDVPAQSERQSIHRVEVATQGDAVSGQVLECAPR